MSAWTWPKRASMWPSNPSGATWTVPNSATGIADWVAQLQQPPVTHLVLEATGGLDLPLLGAAALPVVAGHPRQVRAFAKALGRWAQTDRLDAQGVALFAARVRPALRPLPDQATRTLLTILNAMLKHRTPWHAERLQPA